MKNIGRILRLARPLHPLMWLLAALILIGSIFALVTPLLSKSIVDQITAQLGAGTGSLSALYGLIALAFLFSLLEVLTTSISNRLGDHFSGRLRKFLTEVYYEHVLSLPQSYFDSELSGKIVNQLNRGNLTIENFIKMSTNFMLPTLIQSIFTIAVLAYYSIPVSLLVAALFPIYLVISYYSAKRWGTYEVKKNAIEDSLRGRMQEVITNIKLVKSFIAERREWDDASDKLEKSNQIYAKQSTEYHLFDFGRNFSLIIILVGVNLVVFRNAFMGVLTLGEMVLILQLVNQARRPLFAMSFILSQIQKAEAGSKEYFEVLDIQATEHWPARLTRYRVKHPQITLDNISFEYKDSDLVLKDLSLTLKNGQTYALVGHSGAGKTTLVNLIMKLYEPTAGQITLNHQTYADLGHAKVRQQISFVLQDNELFSTTIRNNVTYGAPKATDKQIITALKQANAWEFVQKLPKDLDSKIGERGVRLSGGQKQRIQIARAILADTPILILDEATSSLDAKSEHEVQTALDKLMQNRLTIIIAHRFSTIQNVDNIIVLDGGQIAASGSPSDLAKQDGIYRDLMKYQLEGNQKLLESYGLVG